VSSFQEDRLERIKSELQSTYTQLKQIESSNTLAKKKFELWKARCRLELVILLIKIYYGVDYEDRRARYTMDGEPQKVFGKVLESITDALHSLLTTNTYEVLEKVRKARDLLSLLESKKL
jgi:hypothetical protein